jgi:hypothetical protein
VQRLRQRIGKQHGKRHSQGQDQLEPVAVGQRAAMPEKFPYAL